MNKLLKIVKYLFLLLVIAGIGTGIFLAVFDINQYKDNITQKASDILGRPVKIKSMSLKLSFIPTIGLEGLVIENPTGFKAEPLLQADAMTVQFPVLPFLIDGRIDMKDFSLDTVKINLIEQSDGRKNWEMTDGDKSTPKSASAHRTHAAQGMNIAAFNVDNLKIKQADIILTQGGKKHTFGMADFTMQHLRVFDGKVSYDGRTIKVKGIMNHLSDLLYKKQNYTFNIEASVAGATAKVSGSIGDLKTFEKMVFNLSAQGSDLSSLIQLTAKTTVPALQGEFSLDTAIQGDLKMLKMPKIDLVVADKQVVFDGQIQAQNLLDKPLVDVKGTLTLHQGNLADSFGIKPAVLTLDVQADSDKITVKNMSLLANKTDVVLMGGMTLTKKPMIQTRIVSEYFDIEDVFSLADTGTPPAEQHETKMQKTEKQFDFSVLNQMNAKVDASFGLIRFPAEYGHYAAVSARAVLSDGRLLINPIMGRFLNGDFAGQVDINSSKQPADIRISLNADGLHLDEIKAISDALTGGVLNASVHVQSSGKTTKALIAGMTGNITAELSEARIVSPEYNAMLKTVGLFPQTRQYSFNFSEADVENKLTCAAANISLKDGVASFKRQIAAETSLLNFVLNGQVDLSTQKVNVSVLPSLTDKNISVENIVLTGSLTDLKIDAQKTASTVVQSAVKTGITHMIQKEKNKQNPQEIQPVQIQPAGALCAAALGKKMPTPAAQVTPKTAPVPAVVTQPVVVTPPPAKVSLKKQLKQRLLNSLSDALIQQQ